MGHARFTTTRWTVIQGAQGEQASRDAACEHFCRSYWYPVYAFIRRRGRDAEEARDLTQAFFAKLLEQDWLAQVERRETRFSTLLITVLKNFLSNQHRRNAAQRRGGGETPLSLDQLKAEDWYGREPAHAEVQPETLFEKNWALAVMAAALARLQEEYEAVGKGRVFTKLSPYLSREPAAGEYALAAGELGISAGNVAVVVHRLRVDFRAMVREEVAAGLVDKSLVLEETRALAAALGVV